jgi:hypothetical protein
MGLSDFPSLVRECVGDGLQLYRAAGSNHYHERRKFYCGLQMIRDSA